MINPKPSAVDMPHSWTPSLAISAAGYPGTLSACQACACRRQGETESGDTPCGASVLFCFPGLGLQSVFAAGGSGQSLGSPLGLCLSTHLHSGLATLIDPLKLRFLGAALERGCPLGSQNSPRPASTSRFRRPSPSVTALTNSKHPGLRREESHPTSDLEVVLSIQSQCWVLPTL